ncbi:MAG: VWA domain-containing protein [Acidobacteriota bacterium]|nr:VWA domain-containing protein [Acidobacteriota bacterium]
MAEHFLRKFTGKKEFVSPRTFPVYRLPLTIYHSFAILPLYVEGNKRTANGIESVVHVQAGNQPIPQFMKNLFRLFYLTIAFSAFASAVAAQTPKPTPKPTPPPGEDNASVKTFEVRLPVTVSDKNKKKDLISGLQRGDFAVFEDGVQQEVTSFTDESTNPGVYVGVLMDTSPSTAGKLKFSKEAAKNFIYTVTRVRKDKAAFMTFDNEVNLRQDFTDKLDLLDKSVDMVKKVGSQTALYDAIWQFSDEKLRSAPGRRIIVLITDGDDTFSRADLQDAIDIAQRTETTIFGISTKAGFLGSVPGVDAGTVKDKGDKYLTQLCEDTGGEAFFTGDMTSLERSFTKISQELRSQYIITYRPNNQNYDGKERKVEVRFTDKAKADDYRIRARKSYRSIRDDIR